MADDESVEDELGDPDREDRGGEESEAEEGKGAENKKVKMLRTPKVRLVVCLLEKTSQRLSQMPSRGT